MRLLAPLALLLTLGPGVAGPAAAETDPSGREWWLAWPQTPDITSNDPDFDTDAELILLTDSAAAVPVTVTAPGLAWSGTTRRGTPARVRIPAALKVESHEVVENKGIHVQSTGCEPLSVLFRVPATNASVGDDAYAALPVSALGTEYHPDTYPGDAEFVVLAVEDNTTVSWDNPHCPGARSFTLDRGEAVQHKCPLDPPNLATRGIVGTRVVADRPVAVFAGSAGSFIIHTYVTVPFPAEIHWDYRDVLLEQMRPIDDGEREYRTVPFVATMPNWPGDYVRIVAACDGTVVEVIDPSRTRTRTLASGEAWDLVEFDAIARTFRLSPDPLTIRASSPIQVSQYSVGNVAAGVGDPSQLLVPGLARASTTALVYLPERYDSHVSLVAPAAATSSVMLDGAPLAATWNAYPDGAWAWARIDGLAAGEHRLTAAEPMAVAVQGSSLTATGAPYEGAYAYPAPSGTAGDAASTRVAMTPLCSLPCTGECVALDVGPGWALHAWSTGDASAAISFCPRVAREVVTVDLADADDCPARGRREVLAREGPTADAGPDVELCAIASTPLGGSPTGSGGQSPYTYLWSPATDLDDPTLANPTATAGTSRSYLVTVTDAQGCVASDQVELRLVVPPAPGSLGNSLLAVRRVADVDARWAADPAASEYRWKQDSDKAQAAPVTVSVSTTPAATLAGAVPAAPTLAYYRVVGASCAGVEGP